MFFIFQLGCYSQIFRMFEHFLLSLRGRSCMIGIAPPRSETMEIVNFRDIQIINNRMALEIPTISELLISL